MVPDTFSHTKILFTAHSLPVSMARGCPYERQVRESCRLVVERLEDTQQFDGWELVYQSRSGPSSSGPSSRPWLGPDVGEWLVAHDDCREVLIVPIGFLSDHVEVVFDLDVEIQTLCNHLGINMFRAGTVGTHPRFVRMIRELIEERLKANLDQPSLGPARSSLGPDGPWPDDCPPDCCPRVPEN